LVFFTEFHELSDFEWEIIKLLLPPKAKVGRLRADDRVVLTVYYMFSLLVVGGWICLLGMVHIRLHGGGLRDGRMKVYGIQCRAIQEDEVCCREILRMAKII